VVFWTATKPSALVELGDLQAKVAKRFAKSGVNIVAINENDEPQAASESATRAGATFPIYRDPDGAALKQVASQKLPRTYLLDADGKIVWLDLEYSRSTRRELLEAIRYLLLHGNSAPANDSAAN